MEESLDDSAMDAFSSEVGNNVETRWERRKEKIKEREKHRKQESENENKSIKNVQNIKNIKNIQNKYCDHQYVCDRYIPARDDSMDSKSDKTQLFNMINKEITSMQETPDKQYDCCLKKSLININNNNNNNINNNSNNNCNETKILSFKDKAPLPSQDFNSHLRAIYTVSANSCVNKNNNNNNNNNFSKYNLSNNKKIRYICQSAERILDAPDLADNFYLNLLDWSKKNIIAIGLGNSLYLWNAVNGQALLLFEREDDVTISSVSWTHTGTHIAVGMDNGIIYIWDIECNKQIRSMKGHSSRVGSLSWNSYMLTSGSGDTSIMNHDVRQKKHHIFTFEGHEQEICGLKWNNIVDGTYLSSGGNDNIVNIWQNKHIKPLHTLTECKSAVKALAWCPWQDGLLATGGGTGDRKIRFYDCKFGTLLNEIDTQSQVCSLLWNPFEKEILSSHGFSKYQLSIWKYPSLIKTHDLTGHTSRVLHTSLSPDGTMVCSAAADETLRLWKVFEKPQKNTNSLHNFNNKPSKLNLHIR